MEMIKNCEVVTDPYKGVWGFVFWGAWEATVQFIVFVLTPLITNAFFLLS